jgi:hypothetical protein
MNLVTLFQGRRPCRRPGVAQTRPGLEPLEGRTLLSVDIAQDFAGLAFDPSVPANLPDTTAAVGPRNVVEATNRDVAVFDKAGTQQSAETLQSFWAPVLPDGKPVPGDIITDPKTTYDESAGRFVLTTFELNFAKQESHLLVAMSKSADPTSGWEMHRIDTAENGTFGDFPQLGWDADAVYVTLNQFKFVGDNPFDHARILTFDTESLADGNSNTFTYFSVDRLPPHFDMQPAIMHGANPGDPMYFVESMVPGGSSGGGGFIDVIRMTDKLSDSPTFNDFKILVPSYNHPPETTQPGGAALDPGDARILSAAWRDGRLVATQTVQADHLARARWYEFNTGSASPTLTQIGEINRGSGVHTSRPSIDIAPNGDLGMTFLESSATEYLSMYITGQKLGGPSGVMQTPVLAKAGEATFRVFLANVEVLDPLRTGDYSSVAIDPENGSFWAANEYATEPLDRSLPRRANWGTWITNFSISDGGSSPAGIAGSFASAASTRALSSHLLASSPEVPPILLEGPVLLGSGHDSVLLLFAGDPVSRLLPSRRVHQRYRTQPPAEFDRLGGA